MEIQKPTNSVLDLIGNTPLLEVTNIDTGPCKLFLKLESQNPGGSIKDRPAKYMIEKAENNGDLKKGGLSKLLGKRLDHGGKRGPRSEPRAEARCPAVRHSPSLPAPKA